MIATVTKTNYIGEITAPPSKSVAHRLIISASLKHGKTVVDNIGSSVDVMATIGCMRSLGANITVTNNSATVIGIETPLDNAILNAEESGSTLRFLLPVVSALGVNALFVGKGKLPLRPNAALNKVLNQNGAKVEGLSVKGKLKSGVFNIDASVSSQYITGLLLALPLLNGDSQIILNGNAVSKDYIEITKNILTISNIKFSQTENCFTVYGNQTYFLPDYVKVEGDWSSASFGLVAGALGKKVKVTGLNVNSKQGDKIILDVIKSTGAEIFVSGDSVTATGGNKTAFTVNLENAPDLAPILSVLATGCKGESRLYGVERLRIKESDRLTAILNMLAVAGVNASYNGEYISVIGGQINSGEFNGEFDHRMVMSATILAGLAQGQSTVSTAQAVEKSYPQFFNDYKKIGGKVNV